MSIKLSSAGQRKLSIDLRLPCRCPQVQAHNFECYYSQRERAGTSEVYTMVIPVH